MKRELDLEIMDMLEEYELDGFIDEAKTIELLKRCKKALTPPTEETKTIDKIIEKLDGVMESNDVKIGDYMDSIHINHKGIQHLQIENATIYKIKCYIETLLEEK